MTIKTKNNIYTNIDEHNLQCIALECVDYGFNTRDSMILKFKTYIEVEFSVNNWLPCKVSIRVLMDEDIFR